MKKVFYIIPLVLLTLFFFIFISYRNSTIPYDYPIKPGTSEWKSLNSNDAMIDACQIPLTVLNDMSTASLVETIINYPLINNMFAYDNIQMGFKAVSSEFNGILELYKRDDGGKELIKKYKLMNSKSLDNRNKITFIEMLLSQPEIISNLNQSQKKSLLKEVNQKYSEKLNNTINPFITESSKILIDILS